MQHLLYKRFFKKEGENFLEDHCSRLFLKDCVKSNGKNTVTCTDAVCIRCLMPCELNTYKHHLCYKAKTFPTLPVPSLSVTISICICRYIHVCGFYKTVELLRVFLQACFSAFLTISHLYTFLYTVSQLTAGRWRVHLDAKHTEMIRIRSQNSSHGVSLIFVLFGKHTRVGKVCKIDCDWACKPFLWFKNVINGPLPHLLGESHFRNENWSTPLSVRLKHTSLITMPYHICLWHTQLENLATNSNMFLF